MKIYVGVEKMVWKLERIIILTLYSFIILNGISEGSCYEYVNHTFCITYGDIKDISWS